MLSRKRIAAIVIPTLFAAPAALYVDGASHGDPARPGASDGLDELLRGMGFNPINPPSNIIELGSIYQVSADGREYRTICRVDPALLASQVVVSPSTREVAEQLHHASYALEGQVAQKINAKLGAENGELIRYSLDDVQLLEVPLAVNRMIFEKLISTPECQAEVDFQLRNNQFVCQGQTILTASAEYRIGTASDISDAAHLRDVVAAVKEAVEADTKAEVETTGTRQLSGKALHYGVKVNPLCAAPPHSRFSRALPHDRFEQYVNFVEFRILESVLPATSD